MCNWHIDEIQVKKPFWLGVGAIPIDKCIAETIQMLWANNVKTLNSCCGHKAEFPSVVIDNYEDAEKTAALLEKYDPERKWDVFQWKLVKTNV